MELGAESGMQYNHESKKQINPTLNNEQWTYITRKSGEWFERDGQNTTTLNEFNHWFSVEKLHENQVGRAEEMRKSCGKKKT